MKECGGVYICISMELSLGHEGMTEPPTSRMEQDLVLRDVSWMGGMKRCPSANQYETRRIPPERGSIREREERERGGQLN